MKKRTFLRLALLGAVIFPVLGLWASTQHLAARLHHSVVLGPPLFSIGATPIYRPWLWVALASKHYETIPKVFVDTHWGATIGLLACVFWALILRRFRKSDVPLTAHGSARWATDEEIEASNLIATDKPKGAIIGATADGRLLAHDGKEHVFCFAPTRSGKGVGLVVPTLLTWTGSVLVLDIKGENWQLTSGWRSLFSHTLYFNPTDERSVHFNPLLEIRKGPGEVRDVQNVVEILCDDGSANSSDFWTASAKSLLTGLILHVLYAEKDKSLAGVLFFLRNPERTQEESFEHMLNTFHLGDNKTHPVVANTAKSMLNQAEKTRSGIVVTAERFLSLFEDPIVAATTRTSDFRLRDMQYATSPVSLYLVIPPADQLRLKPLLRLLIVQLGAALTESLEVQEQHHKLLLLLDEFPVLGRLDWFEAAVAYIAGYDIKAYLIAQDLNQIEKAYGANNAILGNTHVRIAFASNDDRTAKRISDLLGQSTQTKKTQSLSGKRASFSLDNKSESEVEFARSLMTPGEVLQLDTNRAIVMLAGQPPILAHKIRYYEDPFFRARCPGRNADGSIPTEAQARAAGWNPKLAPPVIRPGEVYPDLPKSEVSPWAELKTIVGTRPVEELISLMEPIAPRFPQVPAAESPLISPVLIDPFSCDEVVEDPECPESPERGQDADCLGDAIQPTTTEILIAEGILPPLLVDPFGFEAEETVLAESESTGPLANTDENEDEDSLNRF